MALKRRKLNRKLPRIRMREAPGSIPGEITANEGAFQTSVTAITYNRHTIEERKIVNVSDVKHLLAGNDVTWINVTGLGDIATLKQLGELFHLHRLAIEDVVNVFQRPKVEEYDDHLFVVLKMISRDAESRGLDSEQVSLFFGKNYVLTFQERLGDCFEPVRNRLRTKKGRVRELGADYLCYALIDAIVDAYFPIVDVYGERMERLDELLSQGHPGNFMGVLHNTRGDLMFLRRAIRPLRDELMRLVRDSHPLITSETVVYLRDCYDHGYQLIDLLDNYREMCSDLRDYYLSIVNNRMNEVMKVLTITGTIFIPLSFIAGLYGMNFNQSLPGNMPELNLPYGYVYALGLMVLIASGLIYFVWSKGWLSNSETKVDDVDTLEWIQSANRDSK
jgi:magnesium transporter